MFERLMRRTTISYAIMLIVNPIIILCFQNCSVSKLSDIKSQAQAQPHHEISEPSAAIGQAVK